MKKKSLLLSFLFATVSLAFSQQLIVSPSDSAEIWANVYDEFEPNDVHIYLINNTGNSTTVTWGMTNYSAPSLWEVKLCDNNNCYDLLLNGGPYESLPVAAGDTIDMKFQYTAHLVTGTASTNVYVYVTGDSANSAVFLNYKANLTYTPNGIADNFAVENLKLYPNPVQSSFVVSGLENANDVSFEIYDVKGAAIKTVVSNISATQTEILTGNLPVGDYILKAFDSAGKITGTSRFTKTN
ncbi:MAG: T9SS type A sorting domain-containing protein [Bacteroidota bacterium]